MTGDIPFTGICSMKPDGMLNRLNIWLRLERIKKLKESEIDFVQAGEMQPERDHNFKGEKSTAGSFKEKPNREAGRGWFSYDLKITADAPVILAVDYWGGFQGAKTFDILVNDRIIATENISGKKDGQFITVKYDIPEDISRGKFKITVKFLAHEGNTAGPVFSVRTLQKMNDQVRTEC